MPRWLVVLGVSLLGAWLLLRLCHGIMSISVASDPGEAAWSWVLYNFGDITLLAAGTAGWFAVRHYNRARTTPLSFLAVLAAILFLLNPTFLSIACRMLHVPRIGRGDSEMQSFKAALLAMVIGIVAAVRIRRSRGGLTGMSFAVVGIIGGVLGIGFWVLILFALLASFRNMH